MKDFYTLTKQGKARRIGLIFKNEYFEDNRLFGLWYCSYADTKDECYLNNIVYILRKDYKNVAYRYNL